LLSGKSFPKKLKIMPIVLSCDGEELEFYYRLLPKTN